MDFTCLWSKDAQQKKRKRWADGVARFAPATGALEIWDQDLSVKLSSTRLKPDEVATVLQEDGDEARVGGTSIQIMAKIAPKEQLVGQPPPPQPARKQPTRRSASCSNGGRPSESGAGPALKRRVFKPLVSRLKQSKEPQAHADDYALPSSMTAGTDESAEATVASDNSSVNRTTKPSAASDEGNSEAFRKRPLLVGGRRGGAEVGGARRFHAPRITASAADADAGITSQTDRRDRARGSSSPSSQAPNRLSGGGGQRTNANSGDQDRRPSRVAAAAAVAKPSGKGQSDAAPVVVHPEDLVLEWTAGDPPQPIRAGASLARRLHPHQQEGLKILWECLAGRAGYEGRGAILADEMGLGKTATAIALCTCVLRHRRAECRKAVVVCPSSLVKNWANEFKKWCPLGGGAVAVDQAGAAAAQLVADFKIGAPARYPILIISYELYRNHGKVINTTEGVGLLIADEGHRLKNSAETKTTRALKACPAVMRLVLTGTPMQNDLDEFYAVADFVNPGLLGSLKSFRARYTRPIKAAWDRDADENVREMAAERSHELAEVTGKVVLRRTKDVIRGSLPPALEVVIFCRPSQQQLSLYQRCISSSEARVLLCNDDEEENSGEDRNGFSSESDEAGKSSGKRTEKQRQRSKRSRPQRAITLQGVLPLISTLRRLCNHPDLVDEKYTSDVGDGDGCGENFGSSDESLKGMVNFDDDDWRYRLLKNEEAERDSEGQETAAGDTLGKENTLPNAVSDGLGRGAKGATSGFKAPRLSGARDSTAIETPQVATAVETTRDSAARSVNRTQQYDSQASGKVLVLQELLMAVRRDCPDDKVVVTSNFTSALDVLGHLAEGNGWGFLRLDGGTASNSRQSLVDRFNKAQADNVFLFLLSAKAGGVGLNLVGANRIVLFDSDWNPATDDQAMARVWRLGQTKEVSMYRLLTTGTLEESIFQRQLFKGALYDLIHDSNGAGSPSGHKTVANDIGRGINDACRGREDPRRPGWSSDGPKGGAGTSRRGGQGRGFSQEELKELFVLKTETRSDTYDKLKRRQRISANCGVAAPIAMPRADRYELTDPFSVDDDNCESARNFGSKRNEGCAGWPVSTATASDDDGKRGGGGDDAAAPAVAEDWTDYEGPSTISDSALRCALTESDMEFGSDAEIRSRQAGPDRIVSFVREVKRGRGPMVGE